MIIESTGLDPNIISKVEAHSFVVDMETIFERYCQEVMKSNTNILGSSFNVMNQEEGKKKLFSTGPDKRFAEPDIIIFHQIQRIFQAKLVIDVKYKPKPSRDDINQVIAYAYTYGVKKGLVFR